MKNGILEPYEIAACERFAALLEAGKHQKPKITQAVVADAIGLSQDMVSKMSTGKRPITLDTAIAISEFFRIPVYEICPVIQQKINAAYDSPQGENLRIAVGILQSMDQRELSLAMDILQSVIKKRVS